MRYQFFITDHLGNTRSIIERIDGSTALVQEVHYYPYGAVMEGVGLAGDRASDRWDFLYQGKEFLDFNGANLYDFNTRSYDAYIGRFWQLDGANQFASGYTGMGNMPTVGVDPDGQFAFVPLLIGASIFGGINLAGEAVKGNVNNFGQGLKAFGIGAFQGALAVATGGGSSGTIHFAKRSFYSPETMSLVMGHEYGHALMNGLGFSGWEEHQSIADWEHRAALKNGWQKYFDASILSRSYPSPVTRQALDEVMANIPLKFNLK